MTQNDMPFDRDKILCAMNRLPRNGVLLDYIIWLETRADKQDTTSEWQDISTAPKDGTWFLAYYPFQHNYKENQPEFIEMRYLDDDKNWKGFQCMNGIKWKVTHWMPLPQPPTNEQGEG